jgi:ABC-type proline/glycine betaine transport system substrate-binding protein
MNMLKKTVLAIAIALSLVGGAGQASADPGKGVGIPDGVTWESAGVTWE